MADFSQSSPIGEAGGRVERVSRIPAFSGRGEGEITAYRTDKKSRGAQCGPG